MKKTLAIFLIAAMIFSLAACGSTNSKSEIKQDNSSITPDSNAPAETNINPDNSASSSSETPTDISGNNEPSDNGTRVLIAFFSATGTTKKIAEYAAEAASADLYEIVPAEPYTSDDLNYNDSGSRSTIEMNDPSCRPAIDGGVANMADYSIVFIGYPIWWGGTPRIVSTFVESYDFSGKTVVTFCTSGSSALDDSSISSLVSGADWITGTRLKSSSSQSDVAAWINGLGLDIPAE